MAAQRPPEPSPERPPRRRGSRPPTGADLAAEHHELRARLAALTTATDLPVILRELAALRELLERHFANEEQPGGLHVEVERAAPHLLPMIDRLMAEHGALLADAEAAEATAVACWRGPMAEVLHAVAALAGRLAAHEEREEEVLAASVYQDLGVQE